MSNSNFYKDIATRTNGAVMIGVVGPVRTGKSTFIKRFMELAVLPAIEDEYMRERARDELPQSGSGKTVMTAEPKFVPEEAVGIRVSDNSEISVRLIDCVGYMVNGAAGQLEDGEERMVTTPWLDHEIPMSEAAEIGTYTVIAEHSTIGLVITTDGSICGIPREDYIEPEARAINELKSIGKPFSVIINSADPMSENALSLRDELENKYGVSCICLNCKLLNEQDIGNVMRSVLNEFDVSELAVRLPSWAEALGNDCDIKQQLYSLLLDSSENVQKMHDVDTMLKLVVNSEIIDSADVLGTDYGKGIGEIQLKVPKSLYFELLSRECGTDISDEGEIIKLMREMFAVKSDYDRIKTALKNVREKGYGVVLPSEDELKLEEPQLVKRNGHYSVKLRANAPAIHMLKTSVVTEVCPTIGGENASDEIISFLLQGYEGDMSKLWESNIFGRSLYDLAGEEIEAKLAALPENARGKLQETLQRLINEGNGMLICILL